MIQRRVTVTAPPPELKKPEKDLIIEDPFDPELNERQAKKLQEKKDKVGWDFICSPYFQEMAREKRKTVNLSQKYMTEMKFGNNRKDDFYGIVDNNTNNMGNNCEFTKLIPWQVEDLE